MGKEAKHIVNLVLAAVGLAMGVAVAVLNAIDAEVTTKDMIELLAIGVFALGFLAVNNISKPKQD